MLIQPDPTVELYHLPRLPTAPRPDHSEDDVSEAPRGQEGPRSRDPAKPLTIAAERARGVWAKSSGNGIQEEKPF